MTTSIQQNERYASLHDMADIARNNCQPDPVQQRYMDALQSLLDMTWEQLYADIDARNLKATYADDLRALIDAGYLPANGIVRDLLHLVDIYPVLSDLAGMEARRFAARGERSAPPAWLATLLRGRVRDEDSEGAIGKVYLLKKITALETSVQSLHQSMEAMKNILCELKECKDHTEWVDMMNRSFPGWDSWDAPPIGAPVHDD